MTGVPLAVIGCAAGVVFFSAACDGRESAMRCWKLLSACCLLLVVATESPAQQPPAPTSDKAIATFAGQLTEFPQLLRLDNVLVHDGDTLRADLVLPCGLRLTGQTLRGSGWDCHEVTATRKTGEFAKFTRADWDREIASGIVARDMLAGLLGAAPGGKSPASPSNPTYAVVRNLDAAYGRIEVDIWVETKTGRVNVREWAWRMKLDRSQKRDE